MLRSEICFQQWPRHGQCAPHLHKGAMCHERGAMCRERGAMCRERGAMRRERWVLPVGVGSAVRVCFCIIQSLGLFVEKIADFLVLFVVFLLRIKKTGADSCFLSF